MHRPALGERKHWPEHQQGKKARHAVIIHGLESPLSARAARHRLDGARGEHVHLPRYNVEVSVAALSGAGDRVGALCRAHGADGRGARAAHGHGAGSQREPSPADHPRRRADGLEPDVPERAQPDAARRGGEHCLMTPIIIAALAGPVLNEKVGGRTWLALAGGFAGVLLIVSPGGGLFTWAALLPLASAFMMALYQMLTSKLAGRDAPLPPLYNPAVIGTLLVPMAFPQQLALPSGLLHAALFILIGVLGGLGHFFLIRAHDYAPSSILSPFMYAQLLTALALGWLVFSQLPDGVALAGMATICVSGLLLILGHRRNSVQRT